MTCYKASALHLPVASLIMLLLSPFSTYAAPEVAVPACNPQNAAVVEYTKVIQQAKIKEPLLAEALQKFPKGADLHNHLSGSIMPEDYVAMAKDDGLSYCKDDKYTDRYTIVPAYDTKCSDPRPLATANKSELQKIVDSLSMANFSLSSKKDGHDQFFATFGRFSAVSGAPWNTAPMLAKVLRQARNDSTSHVETMMSFQSPAVETLASILRRVRSKEDFQTIANYQELYEILEMYGLRDAVTGAKKDIAANVSRTNAILRCGLPESDPACNVSYAFISSVNRKSNDLAQIFAQAAFSFALASAEKRVVGVTLLSAEDDPNAMANFPVHMQIFKFMHEKFPNVNIALHAGELTPCFVAADKSGAFKEHLVRSLDAGAKRIGHGVSFAYLDEGEKKEVEDWFRKNDAAVEIMFTSNAQILGVAGEEHPFQSYRKHQIPMMFSTDDEGVSYADYTSEWIYGFVNYGLTGEDLVRLARESLQRSFLEGDALWSDLVNEKPVEPCVGMPLGTATPTKACQYFLARSAKAEAQWKLEGDLAAYFKAGGLKYAELFRMKDVTRYAGR